MQKQLGIKIAIIFVISLLLYIPITMTSFKVEERQSYLNDAKQSVAESWTGEQRIMTPVLVIPYQTKYTSKDTEHTKDHKTYLLPSKSNIDSMVDNRNVKKGIYDVPVYDSTLVQSGHFSKASIQNRLKELRATEHFYALGTPYLAVHFSDVRGITNNPTLVVNEKNLAVNPGSGLHNRENGISSPISGLNTLATDLNYRLELGLRGMGSMSFIQLADDAQASITSNWPHPEFIGASLPYERSISDRGFTASWRASKFTNTGATIARDCFRDSTCYNLSNTDSGVRFIEPVNIYSQSDRSIKYAILFIGLSFITFFIFEHLKRVRIHPIQYTFVGLAIAVFYLLLISLAEHMSFGLAYLIGAVACSGLILFYTQHMLKSLKSAGFFVGMIAMLYGTLYVIVQAEDFALLMGSLLVFFILSVLMFVTRKIDWYAIGTNRE